MGENLPYAHVARRQRQCLDHRAQHLPGEETDPAIISGKISIVTTSGNFHTQALINAMLEVGADRIMFSTDWPFENIDHAAHWFDACPISEPDRSRSAATMRESCSSFRIDGGTSPVLWRNRSGR